VFVERPRETPAACARVDADAVHIEEAGMAREEPGVVRSLRRSVVIEGQEEGIRPGSRPDGGGQRSHAEEPAQLFLVDEAQLDCVRIVEREEGGQVLGSDRLYRGCGTCVHGTLALLPPGQTRGNVDHTFTEPNSEDAER